MDRNDFELTPGLVVYVMAGTALIGYGALALFSLLGIERLPEGPILGDRFWIVVCGVPLIVAVFASWPTARRLARRLR